MLFHHVSYPFICMAFGEIVARLNICHLDLMAMIGLAVRRKPRLFEFIGCVCPVNFEENPCKVLVDILFRFWTKGVLWNKLCLTKEALSFHYF